MVKKVEYTSETFVHVKDLDAVRMAINGYLPDNGPIGFRHMVWEYVTNSVDEFVALEQPGYVITCIFCDPASKRFQIAVLDNGRGIPSASLRGAYTELHCSGKLLSNSAYFNSTGQFGLGSKVGAATSKHFRAISHNYLENCTASLRIENGTKITSDIKEGVNIPNGVALAFEPDLKYYVDCDDYANNNYTDLVDLSADLSVFNELVDFKVYRIEHLLPKEFWEVDGDVAYAMLHSLLDDNPPIYDTYQLTDKTARLFDLWELVNAPSFRDRIDGQYVKAAANPEEKDTRLNFAIYAYFTKKSRTVNPQWFVTVNNVTMFDYSTSSVTNTILRVFREKIAPYIEDEQLREYVASPTGYRFPTLLAGAGIFYNGAKHGGTTKSTFRNKVFEQLFYQQLLKSLEDRPEEYWQDIVKVLNDDILQQYSQFYNVPIKKADVKKVFVNLFYSSNYFECTEVGKEAELFIVEGSSAANIVEARDPRYQAVYTTKGAPKNPATTIDNINQNRRELLRNKIYHDIMTILGITPQTTDMSTCRFGKIVIATDADPDGYHIGALHVHDLALLNPLIVRSGLVWVANPPLYSMTIGSKGNLFLRDMPALMDARIEFIYKSAIDFNIVIERNDGSLSEIETTPSLYREVGYLMNYIGEQFDIVAAQLNIPLLLLERLVYAINYLLPYPRVERITDFFKSADGDDQILVTYDNTNCSIVVSIGRNDYTINLTDVGKMIQEQLLPTLKHFQYNHVFFKIRGKLGTSEIKEPTLVSPMKFYELLKGLNSITKIYRYKGLGQMPPESCFTTLMDPSTRSLTHITDIGNMEEDYALVGKDSTARKQLMSDNGSLSSAFQRVTDLLQSEWNEVQ